MAGMLMLSVAIFMIGMVNVYKVSRAKLRAQNLADAVAQYIAGHMTQAMNHVADRNEWLNHLYADPNNPNGDIAGSDPCRVPPNSPPGLGCFATNRANSGTSKYVFQGGMQAVQSYARLVHTINQIQGLFSDTYNTFIGANSNVQSSNGQSTFQDNLLRMIPDLNDPNVQLVVYNSQATKSNADTYARQALQASPSGTSGPSRLQLGNIEPIRFKVTQPITVHYCGALLFGCGEKTTTLDAALGQPVGFMDIDPASAMIQQAAGQNGNPVIGAGAIVTITISLIGLGKTQVQARSAAYVVWSAGSLRPNAQGSFSPTYWIKLGKP